ERWLTGTEALCGQGFPVHPQVASSIPLPFCSFHEKRESRTSRHMCAQSGNSMNVLVMAVIDLHSLWSWKRLQTPALLQAIHMARKFISEQRKQRILQAYASKDGPKDGSSRKVLLPNTHQAVAVAVARASCVSPRRPHRRSESQENKKTRMSSACATRFCGRSSSNAVTSLVGDGKQLHLHPGLGPCPVEYGNDHRRSRPPPKPVLFQAEIQGTDYAVML
ncbi:unnamed protein product, partial [Effrenium voratum]